MDTSVLESLVAKYMLPMIQTNRYNLFNSRQRHVKNIVRFMEIDEENAEYWYDMLDNIFWNASRSAMSDEKLAKHIGLRVREYQDSVIEDGLEPLEIATIVQGFRRLGAMFS